MIHSYTFLHFDKTSQCNHTQAIGHNCFPQLLYNILLCYISLHCKQSRVFVDGPCGIGPVPRGNGTVESKTAPAVCKVFVPAIVSKCLLMMQRPHAVITSVSQGQRHCASSFEWWWVLFFFCRQIFVTLNVFISQQAHTETNLTNQSKKQNGSIICGADYETEMSHWEEWIACIH